MSQHRHPDNELLTARLSLRRPTPADELGATLGFCGLKAMRVVARAAARHP